MAEFVPIAVLCQQRTLLCSMYLVVHLMAKWYVNIVYYQRYRAKKPQKELCGRFPNLPFAVGKSNMEKVTFLVPINRINSYI